MNTTNLRKDVDGLSIIYNFLLNINNRVTNNGYIYNFKCLKLCKLWKFRNILTH